MTWVANVRITNHTQYTITVTHNTTGDLTDIAPDDSWSWSTSDVNNTMALKFWQTPAVYYMQGSLAFGPEAGVYMDRGWLDSDDQNITLGGNVNGTLFTQTRNGGATVVAWNQFEQGGSIEMTFYQDS